MKRFLFTGLFTLSLCGFLRSNLCIAQAVQYPSVKIGNQEWMTFNWDGQMPKSWYFNNDSATNHALGRLYFYSNALAGAPSGWHLPTMTEWTELINNFGGLDKAATSLLEGGTSGLNLPLSGNKSANISPTDIFNFKDLQGYYWTATTDGDQTAYAISFTKGHVNIIMNTYRRANGFSVRYLKDKP